MTDPGAVSVSPRRHLQSALLFVAAALAQVLVAAMSGPRFAIVYAVIALLFIFGAVMQYRAYRRAKNSAA